MLRPTQSPVLACLLGLCLSAPAHADTWNFKYEYFQYHVISSDDEYRGVGLGFGVEGSFSGVDSDLDGVLELNELSSFRAGMPMMGCPTGMYIGCGLDAFRFSPEGGLHFSGWSIADLGNNGMASSLSVTTGQTSVLDVRSPTHFQHHETLTWTPETRLIVTQVPEPSTYLMFGAGALLLGALAMRRQRLHRDSMKKLPTMQAPMTAKVSSSSSNPGHRLLAVPWAATP